MLPTTCRHALSEDAQGSATRVVVKGCYSPRLTAECDLTLGSDRRRQELTSRRPANMQASCSHQSLTQVSMTSNQPDCTPELSPATPVAKQVSRFLSAADVYEIHQCNSKT